MNKNQKDYIQTLFNDEKEVLKAIENAYHDAIYDIVTEITSLEEFTHNQAKIYQKRYQEQLLDTINKSFNKLLGKEYKSISEYLEDSFTNGYVGTMYDLHGQDIPLIIPFSHEEVVDAITKDTKLKSPLYQTLGQSLKDVKKKVNNELARGILNNDHYDDIARNISNSLNLPRNKAKTIARTEGHRVTMNASFNAQTKAKELGANIVKQWDSTLDSRTRPSHQVVDGELRELDETFSNGLIYPGDPNGKAKEVVNCRCVLLQRARWALDEEELETLKERAKYFELDKEGNFKEYKEKYLKVAKEEVISKEPKRIDLTQTTTKLKKSLKSDYTEFMDLVYQDEDISNLYTIADELDQLKKTKSGGVYKPLANEINYDYVVGYDRHKYSTLAHEYGHFFDAKGVYENLNFKEVNGIHDVLFGDLPKAYIQKQPVASKSDEFLKALRKDKEFIKINIEEIIKICKDKIDLTCGIQDALDGMGFGRICWGHGDKYYNRYYTTSIKGRGKQVEVQSFYNSLGLNAKNQTEVKKIARDYETARELWANIASAYTCGVKEEIELFEKYFPGTTKEFKNIIRRLKHE